MMNRTYHMRRKTDSKGKPCLHDWGIIWGYGRDTIPHIVKENDDKIIVRLPACRDWAGIGTTKSYPARFMVLRKTGEKDERGEIMAVLGEWKYSHEKGSKLKALDMALAVFNSNI